MGDFDDNYNVNMPLEGLSKMTWMHMEDLIGCSKFFNI